MTANSGEDGGYDVVVTRTGRRALEEQLPEAVAAAAFEFIAGPLRADPDRVGEPLREPLAAGRTSNGVFGGRVMAATLPELIVEVVSVVHRRDAYHR